MRTDDAHGGGSRASGGSAGASGIGRATIAGFCGSVVDGATVVVAASTVIGAVGLAVGSATTTDAVASSAPVAATSVVATTVSGAGDVVGGTLATGERSVRIHSVAGAVGAVRALAEKIAAPTARAAIVQAIAGRP